MRGSAKRKKRDDEGKRRRRGECEFNRLRLHNLVKGIHSTLNWLYWFCMLLFMHCPVQGSGDGVSTVMC